ncbi:MAG: DUF763 domain-containing protein [Syntrophomonas sp.]
MQTGTANLPLHGGKCPAWLFVHMKALSAAIMEVIIEDAGVETVLERLSNPYWFQALGCVVGFDWHSSGVTTTVCGALKEGLARLGPEAGLFITGGKGKVARNTPQEIERLADKYALAINPQEMVYASKMSAKVDSAAVQDGYQIYHHCFIFTSSGKWAVIQQGMNDVVRQARRYHWLSSEMDDFTVEPQAAICCDQHVSTLNLVSEANAIVRQTSCELLKISPEKVVGEIEKIKNSYNTLKLPRGHAIPRTSYLNKSLHAAYEQHPNDFEQLLQIQGVGPSTLRALCLVAEVAFGVKASYSDPVRYAFAHGGKDGFPFPVNEADIENSYSVLNKALRRARAGHSEQLQALKNLSRWHSEAAAASRCTPQYQPVKSQPILPSVNLLYQGRVDQTETIVQPSLFFPSNQE